MRTFTANVWKEWQEQRRWAGLLIPVTGALVIGSVLAFPGAWRGYDFIPLVAGCSIAILTGLTVALRVMGQDLEGGGIRFLDRLPGGLGAVFAAKLVFVLGATLLLAVYGGGLAGAVRSIAFGMDDHWPHFVSAKVTAFWLPILGASVFGTMAAACWVPKTGLAVPAVTLLLAFVIGPAWLMVELTPFFPVDGGSILHVVRWLAVAFAPVALVSFVRGWHAGGNARNAFKCGALILTVVALPVWGWTGWRAWTWLHPDPSADGIMIVDVFVAPDLSTAYLTLADREGKQAYSLRADLSTGGWQQVGNIGSYYTNVATFDRSGWTSLCSGPLRYVHRIDRDEDRFSRTLIDTASGEELAVRRGRTLDRELRDRLRADQRSSTPFRLHDGRRIWFLDGRWEVEAGPSFEVWMDLEGAPCSYWCGAAGMLTVKKPDGSWHLLDLDRKWVATEAFNAPSPSGRVRAMMEGGWVVSDADGAWMLRHPETGAERSLLCLEPADHVFAAQDGHRLWVRSRVTGISETAQGDIHLVDLDSGERSRLEVPGLAPGAIEGAFNPEWPMHPIRTPGGRRLFLVTTATEATLVRFDGLQEGFTRTAMIPRDPSTPAMTLRALACPSEDSVIVLVNERSIERLRFGSEDRVRLFAR